MTAFARIALVAIIVRAAYSQIPGRDNVLGDSLRQFPDTSNYGNAYDHNTYANNERAAALPDPISVTVQLKNYANPRLALDESRTCACNGGECLRASLQGMGFLCFFSFMIIVSSAESSVHYYSTDFLPLNSVGAIDGNYTAKFTNKHDFFLSREPMAINVFVYNLGPVVNTHTNKLEQVNTVYHVDTFVLPLNETSSSMDHQQQQVELTGRLSGTRLSLSYSTACRNDLLGKGCDLMCNKSSINSANAVCHSVITGYFSICRFGSNGHVTDCKRCPWGIKEQAYCMDQNGGVLEAQHAGVVDEGFRTATIVLGLLSALLLLILFGLGFLLLCWRPKRAAAASHGVLEQHLLPQVKNDEERPLAQNANSSFSSSSTPQPVPRNQHPHLNLKINKWSNEGKPIVRAPYPLPMASHLGGGIPASLNSSFSSVMPPVAPSVSADV